MQLTASHVTRQLETVAYCWQKAAAERRCLSGNDIAAALLRLAAYIASDASDPAAPAGPAAWSFVPGGGRRGRFCAAAAVDGVFHRRSGLLCLCESAA